MLEHVAGGYAFRAAREAAEACARLVERPAQRGLSQAALETLAIVAYLGPVSRARDRPHPRSGLGLGRRRARRARLVAEAGREEDGGAIRYRTTPLFERVFGLTSLAELPALDDLAGDARSCAPGSRPSRAAGARSQAQAGRWDRPLGEDRALGSRYRAYRPRTISSASSRVKARSVSVVTLPSRVTATRICAAVSSSGASKISTTS